MPPPGYGLVYVTPLLKILYSNPMINKDLVWQCLFKELNNLVTVAQAAAQRAHETATDDENIAENKYDTLGLEAAYLAQGQQHRLLQCQQDLDTYQELHKRYCNQEIVKIGSLAIIVDEDDGIRYFFIGSSAGGVKLLVDQVEVLVITPDAPLGKALMGTRVDDEVSLMIGGKSITYEVTAIS